MSAGRVLAVILCLSSFAVAPLRAGERWIRLSTPHFEMYTTNGERQAAAALQIFEQVRYFFLQNSSSKSAPDATVRIIAFRSEKEYKPYRLNGGAFAYYLRSRKVDYIVMQDISPEHYQTAAHEYTHLIVEHLGLRLPVWLNEGLADVYSSLEPRGDKALVGRPLAGRMLELSSQRWLDLNSLFAVTPDSPYYNESDKMSIFYAESWALTHMLALGKDYQPAFMKFLAEISAGHPSAECLEKVYGRSPAQVMKDLQHYVHQSSVQAAIYNVKLRSADLEPAAAEAAPLEVDLALADLLASNKNTAIQAEARLQKLAAEHPESPDVQESLGYLAWQLGDTTKAEEYFARAIDKGSHNGEMILQESQLLSASGAPAGRVLPLLQKAAQLKPADLDVWFALGIAEMSARQWGAALQALSHVNRVKPERAFPLFSGLAYCYLQLKSFEPARASAEKAKQYAESPEQLSQISKLLDYLDAAIRPEQVRPPETPQPSLTQSAMAPPAQRNVPQDRPLLVHSSHLQHVEGIVTSFECVAKSPRLHVLVSGKEMIFEMADPESIVVRNTQDGHYDFSCGAQKPFHIGIFYEPAAPGGKAGVVKELVF